MGHELRDFAGSKVFKINASDWYEGRFALLCIILFFLEGLFTGLSIGAFIRLSVACLQYERELY